MAMSRISSVVLHRSSTVARWLCTEAEPAAETVKNKSAMFHKVSRLNPSSKTGVKGILDEWVSKGIPIKRFDLINLVGFLRGRKRFRLALQLYDWMENSKLEITNADHAVRINLLCKTKDLASAEKYFDSLQDSEKTQKTFGAILSSYCNEKAFDKALETFEKMKESNCVSTLNYNSVLALYYNMDQPEKVISLAQEMEEKHIPLDIYTYNIIINSYAALKDLDAVEEVVKKMKSNNVECNSFTYGNLANIYVSCGLFEKANHFLEMMEKLENEPHEVKIEASRTRLKLYSEMNDLLGVKGAWESLKSNSPEPNNTSYLFMLSALSKLGDQESLENVFKEWEMSCSLYDSRLPNVLLRFYLSREMIEDAALLYERIVDKGMKPNFSTLKLFTALCIGKGQIELALKYLETGADEAKQSKKDFLISKETISCFLNYFEEKRDVDRAEKFVEIMSKIDHIDSSIYDSLLSKIKESHVAMEA